MKITPKQYAKLLFEVDELKENDKEKKARIAKIANFLMKKRDQRKLAKIEFEFEKILISKGKKLFVLLESAHALEADQLEKIRKFVAVEKKVSPEVIEIEKKTDKNLLGGLKVTIGNEIIDSSLATKINMLKKSLVA